MKNIVRRIALLFFIGSCFCFGQNYPLSLEINNKTYYLGETKAEVLAKLKGESIKYDSSGLYERLTVKPMDDLTLYFDFLQDTLMQIAKGYHSVGDVVEFTRFIFDKYKNISFLVRAKTSPEPGNEYKIIEYVGVEADISVIYIFNNNRLTSVAESLRDESKIGVTSITKGKRK